MPTSLRRFLHSEIAISTGLTLLAAFVRLWGLTRQSIWVDESFSIHYSGLFTGMPLRRFLLNLQGPLHTLVLFLWARLFGPGEFSLRSLQALAGIATVPLFLWALRPLRRPLLAWTAAGLLALSPFHLWYSQEIRGYAFVLFFAVLSQGIFTRLVQGRGRLWPAYTATSVLGLLSNLSFTFLLLTHAWILLLRGRRSGLWGRAAASWGVTLLCLAPWLVQFWHRIVEPSGALDLRPVPVEERYRGRMSSPLLGIPYIYSAFSYGFSYGPSLREYHEMPGRGTAAVLLRHWPALLWALLAFGSLALWGAMRLWREGPTAREWIWLGLLPVLLTYLVATRNLKVVNARYAAAALPAFLLVISAAVLAPRRVLLRLCLAGAVLLPAGISLVQYQTDPNYWKEGAREAARFLHREIRPGDLLFAVGNIAPLEEYYWQFPESRPEPLDLETAVSWRGTPAEQQRRFEALLAGRRRIFVLFLRSRDIDPDGDWTAYLDRSHPQARRRMFTGVEIRVIDGGAPGPLAGEGAVRPAGGSLEPPVPGADPGTAGAQPGSAP